MSHGGVDKGFAKSEFDVNAQPANNLGRFGKKGTKKEEKDVEGKGKLGNEENGEENKLKREPNFDISENDRNNKKVKRSENEDGNGCFDKN